MSSLQKASLSKDVDMVAADDPRPMESDSDSESFHIREVVDQIMEPII